MAGVLVAIYKGVETSASTENSYPGHFRFSVLKIKHNYDPS